MSSHVDLNVNDKFLKWLNNKYSEHGEVTTTRGNKHDCLGMTIELKDGEIIIDMTYYIEKCYKNFL